jgi:hypothetical protein
MLLLAILAVAATEIPGIDGHMTDPGRKLSDADKRSIEEKLGKIQDETHIDVAGWISDSPEDQAMALGNRAFRSWNIGRDWDNGVFLFFPAEGRVRIIQTLSKPALPAPDVALLSAADAPDMELRLRLERLADKARTLLVARTTKQARPWGEAHPEMGHRWLALAGVVLLAALAMSLARGRAPAA